MYLSNSKFKIPLFQCPMNIHSIHTVFTLVGNGVSYYILSAILIIEVVHRTLPKMLSVLKHTDIDVSNLLYYTSVHQSSVGRQGMIGEGEEEKHGTGFLKCRTIPRGVIWGNNISCSAKIIAGTSHIK